MEVLISLGLKLLPYIAAVAGLVAVYFGIKRKGAVEAREKIEKQIEAERQALQARVDKAASQDETVEDGARRERDRINQNAEKEINAPVTSPDDSRFKF